MMNRVVLIIIWICGCVTLKATGPLNESVWSDLYLIHSVQHFDVQHRLGNRYNVQDPTKNINHYRIRASRGDGLVSYSFGTALFFNNTFKSAPKELRPWGGLQLKVPFGSKLSLKNFVRLEHRLSDLNECDFIESGMGRLRYSMRLQGAVIKSSKASFLVLVKPEMFFGLGQYDQFDYNELRLTGGLSVGYKHLWRAGLNYIRKLPQDNRFEFNSAYYSILQLSLKHFIN